MLDVKSKYSSVSGTLGTHFILGQSLITRVGALKRSSRSSRSSSKFDERTYCGAHRANGCMHLTIPQLLKSLLSGLWLKLKYVTKLTIMHSIITACTCPNVDPCFCDAATCTP